MKSLKRALKRGKLRVLFNPLTINLEMYRLTTRGRWQRTHFGKDIMSASQYSTDELDALDKQYLKIAEQLEAQHLAKLKENESK